MQSLYRLENIHNDIMVRAEHKRAIIVAISGMVSVFLFFPQLHYSFSDKLNPGVYSIDSKIFDKNYQYWVQQWWKWNNGIRADMHPRDEPNNSCNVNQEGPVFFLPDFLNDMPQVRTCEVQAEKAILIPIMTGTGDDVENRTKHNIQNAKLIEDSKFCNSIANNIRKVLIDDRPIIGLTGDSPYRTNSSGFFYMEIAKGGIYPDAVSFSPIKAFADGWFLFLEPLKPGEQKHIQLVEAINPPAGDPLREPCKQFGSANWIIKSVS